MKRPPQQPSFSFRKHGFYRCQALRSLGPLPHLPCCPTSKRPTRRVRGCCQYWCRCPTLPYPSEYPTVQAPTRRVRGCCQYFCHFPTVPHLSRCPTIPYKTPPAGSAAATGLADAVALTVDGAAGALPLAAPPALEMAEPTVTHVPLMPGAMGGV